MPLVAPDPLELGRHLEILVGVPVPLIDTKSEAVPGHRRAALTSRGNTRSPVAQDSPARRSAVLRTTRMLRAR